MSPTEKNKIPPRLLKLALVLLISQLAACASLGVQP